MLYYLKTVKLSLWTISVLRRAFSTLLAPHYSARAQLPDSLWPQRRWNWKGGNEWRCNLKVQGNKGSVFFRQSLSAAQSKKLLAHLDSSSTHNALSGWLKRNGGFYCGVCVASLESLELLKRRATAVLQTSQTFFIYFLWNIDACYERFKIMCLASSGPATLFSNA